jgi:Ca2+:H+ antiporter
LRDLGPALFGLATSGLFLGFPETLLPDPSLDVPSLGLFLWLFLTILWCTFGMVLRAESLGEMLGEPYGTLLLTLSVITVELSLIAAVMILGDNQPTLARDTMFSVLMIVLNGMVGLALLFGGLRFGEQHYNLQGAKAFLGVLVALSVLTLVLPNFTVSTELPEFTRTQAVFFAAMTITLYGVFLAIETVRHRNQFLQPGRPAQPARPDPLAYDETGRARRRAEVRSIPYHALLLLLTMLPVLLLAKELGAFVDFGIETLRAPVELGGVVIAVLVLAPEGLGAHRAVLGNRLQGAVNTLLGSSLATVGLIVPTVLALGVVLDLPVEIGLAPVEMVLLMLTLAVGTLTFGGGRTNILHGAIHLTVFFAFLVLLFEP